MSTTWIQFVHSTWMKEWVITPISLNTRRWTMLSKKPKNQILETRSLCTKVSPLVHRFYITKRHNKSSKRPFFIENNVSFRPLIWSSSFRNNLRKYFIISDEISAILCGAVFAARSSSSHASIQNLKLTKTCYIHVVRKKQERTKHKF